MTIRPASSSTLQEISIPAPAEPLKAEPAREPAAAPSAKAQTLADSQTIAKLSAAPAPSDGSSNTILLTSSKTKKK